MYRPQTPFCFPGGLGSQSQPQNILTGMAYTWRAGKTHSSPALHLHSAHPGRCSKWSHSPHQTSLTRSKCSSLSLVEAASRYKAAFSELKLLRQNRDQWPFHLPWLIFSAVTEMKVLRALKDKQGLYIILQWTVSLSPRFLALHWLLITFLRHQFIPLEQELSTWEFHSTWGTS